jgi:hypothetical protein
MAEMGRKNGGKMAVSGRNDLKHGENMAFNPSSLSAETSHREIELADY